MNGTIRKSIFNAPISLWGFAGLCIVSLFILPAAYGAAYPSKAIQMICPFPPGGKADMTGRLFAKKLSSLLRQPVVVVNKSGGMGTLGVQTAADAPADGYTILVSGPTIIIGPMTTKSARHTIKDFTPVNLATSATSVLSVKKDAPWKTVGELIADAKRTPGKFTYSSAGPNTGPHLAGELFKMGTGTEIAHVPLDGASAAIATLLGGHTNMTFLDLGTVRNYLDAGAIRTLAVMSTRRLDEFPQLPTMIELGYPNVISTTWVGFFVPVKTPAPVVKKIAAAFNDSFKDKAILTYFKMTGEQIENLDPAEALRYILGAQERFAAVIKKTKSSE